MLAVFREELERAHYYLHSTGWFDGWLPRTPWIEGDTLPPRDWTTTMDHFARRMAAMEEFDETTRLWMQCQPQPLAESAIDELQQKFGASRRGQPWAAQARSGFWAPMHP